VTRHRGGTAALGATLAVLGALAGASSASGQVSPAAIGVAAGAGAAAASGGSSPLKNVGTDLRDWTDPRTGFAGRLAQGCGMAIEARLTATGTADYLTLTVANASDARAFLVAREVAASFSNGWRRALSPVAAENTEIPVDGWLNVAFEFPAKSDFRGQAWVTVDLPLSYPDSGESCTAHVEFRRHRRADDARTTDVVPALEIDFGAGVRATTTGASWLGRRPGFAFELGFAFFPWSHHGWTIDLAGDVFGGARPAPLPSTTSPSSLGLEGAGIFAGYAYKRDVLPALTVDYALTPGLYVLQIVDDQGKGRETLATLAIRQRLRAAIRAVRSPTLWLEIGPEVVDTIVPFGKLGGQPVANHAIGGLVEVTLTGE
jgi:hypothetical protein